ncbi:MAG: RidA family protein [Proteobacteria bacterium]|nr:RidA family protein [Pseudomonadota bacterium]
MKLFNPDTTANPASNYSHGALIPAGAERLVIAGQVGIAPDGILEAGFEAQSRRAWSNLFAVLETAGMAKTDLVKVTIFVTLAGVTAAYRAIRDEVMEGHMPPMTYLVVAGLAPPGMLVEIEGEAVRG